MEIITASSGARIEVNIEELRKTGTALPAHGEISTEAVFGNDDRQSFYDPSYPWSITGMMQYDKGAATGIMIGNRLVLANYHLLDKIDKNLRFVPAYHEHPPAGKPTSPYGEFKVVEAFYWPVLREGSIKMQRTFDFAIYKLETAPNIGYATCELFQDGWVNQPMWLTQGYPSSYDGLPTYEKSVGVNELEDIEGLDAKDKKYEGKLLLTSIDAEPGQSGSPLFRIIDNYVYVSATLSGGDATATKFSGCGQAMMDLLIWTREHHDGK
jgi:V8-like Glu-specific endopeptidase